MAGVGDSENDARRVASLRRVSWIVLAGDVFMALLFIVTKDGFGLGNLAYLLAVMLVVAGVAMFFLLPRFAQLSSRRMQQKHD